MFGKKKVDKLDQTIAKKGLKLVNGIDRIIKLVKEANKLLKAAESKYKKDEKRGNFKDFEVSESKLKHTLERVDTEVKILIKAADYIYKENSSHDNKEIVASLYQVIAFLARTRNRIELLLHALNGAERTGVLSMEEVNKKIGGAVDDLMNDYNRHIKAVYKNFKGYV